MAEQERKINTQEQARKIKREKYRLRRKWRLAFRIMVAVAGSLLGLLIVLIGMKLNEERKSGADIAEFVIPKKYQPFVDQYLGDSKGQQKFMGEKEANGHTYISFMDDDAYYSINADRNVIERIVNISVDEDGEPNLSLEEAEVKALGFVSRYRADVDMSMLTRTEACIEKHEDGNSGYAFEWRLIRDGQDLRNVVGVKLTAKGELKSLTVSENTDWNAPAAAFTVAEESAKYAAVDYIRDNYGEAVAARVEVKSVRKMADKNSAPCYAIRMEGADEKGASLLFVVYVDGVTGKVSPTL